ncbi:hypothetical protein DENSPDRAFT_886881 [Dentipellis sp. KUC8613]|nr:hypothetical protein DENSPDRAFT_886881 [Dentipellis sp. KUC8613]
MRALTLPPPPSRAYHHPHAPRAALVRSLEPHACLLVPNSRPLHPVPPSHTHHCHLTPGAALLVLPSPARPFWCPPPPRRALAPSVTLVRALPRPVPPSLAPSSLVHALSCPTTALAAIARPSMRSRASGHSALWALQPPCASPRAFYRLFAPSAALSAVVPRRTRPLWAARAFHAPSAASPSPSPPSPRRPPPSPRCPLFAPSAALSAAVLRHTHPLWAA